MLQMTGSFKESLPSSIAAPTQKGELKREEEKGRTSSWSMQDQKQQSGRAQISPRLFL